MRSNEFSMCNIVVLLLSLCYKILMFMMRYETFISQQHTPNVTIHGITSTSKSLNISNRLLLKGQGGNPVNDNPVNDNKFLSLK
jgi:hypothetical protein